MNGVVDERPALDRFLHRYPPRSYRLEDYKRWFPRTGAIMRRYLRDFRALPLPSSTRTGIAVFVVSPWVFTPAPWYSLMLAIGLASRGRPVEIVWDDSAFPEPGVDAQNDVIAKVLRDVAEYVPVHRVSAAAPRPEAGDAVLVGPLADQNLLWATRGGRVGAREQSQRDAMAQSLAESLARIRTLVDRDHLELIVVCGGIYGTSGLFLHAGRERGVRVATFDVDRSTAQICVDGIAAQSHDVPRAFQHVWARGPEMRAAVTALGRVEFEQRRAGRDRYGFQAAAAAAPHQGVAAVIPMNVVFDSAALGRHGLFVDTAEWITRTVETVLAEGVGPVVVRQHPSERRVGQRSAFDIGKVLAHRFGDDTRVRFVPGDAAISTYDLLDAARVVLPFVSTIGIEAAAIGKPTLISGDCFYGPLGFVHTAGSLDEYLAAVRRGVHGNLGLLPDQVERAWVCYGMAAVANRIPSDFIPHPDDFWTWCKRSPATTFAEPEVATILDALDGDVPVSQLRIDRLIGP